MYPEAVPPPVDVGGSSDTTHSAVKSKSAYDRIGRCLDFLQAEANPDHNILPG